MKRNLSFRGQVGVGQMVNGEAVHDLTFQVKVEQQRRAYNFTCREWQVVSALGMERTWGSGERKGERLGQRVS